MKFNSICTQISTRNFCSWCIWLRYIFFFKMKQFFIRNAGPDSDHEKNICGILIRLGLGIYLSLFQRHKKFFIKKIDQNLVPRIFYLYFVWLQWHSTIMRDNLFLLLFFSQLSFFQKVVQIWQQESKKWSKFFQINNKFIK